MAPVPSLALAALALACTVPVGADPAAQTVGASGQARSPDDIGVELTIEIRDLARVPPAIMRETKVEIARTFVASGVRITWLGEGDSLPDGSTLTVFVVGRLARPIDIEPDATLVGLAPLRGSWVQVFYGSIREAVARRPISTGVVLAQVISHELGHLLLPPGSHAPYGIMRRAVDLEHPTLRRFTGDQSRLIRAALATGQRYASACRHR